MFDYRDIGNFFNCEVKCELPSNKIYDFNGTFLYPSAPGDAVEREIQEPLTLENTMWANTVLASQGFVLGLIVYTGAETRAQMNQKKARSKMCLLDIEVNRLSKVLFSLMVALAFTISVLNGKHGDHGLFFLRCVLLLSSIIPISLRVNLDLGKLYYSYNINMDEEIPGSIARNSNIPEDLGRLSYLITDKTGTLTQNEMLLKKVCTEFAIFEADDPNHDLEDLLIENCTSYPEGPANEVAEGGQAEASAVEVDGGDPRPRKRKKRDQGNNVRDLLTAFAICNNVTPVPDDPDLANALEVAKDVKGRGTVPPGRDGSSLLAGPYDNLAPNDGLRRSALPSPRSARRLSGRKNNAATNMILQASSPDEVALVKYSNSVQMELVERDRTFVQLRNCKGIYENYEIIANFPFSSQSKKMSVLLRQRETGRILYYVKGAEVVMEGLMKSTQRALLLEFCE